MAWVSLGTLQVSSEWQFYPGLEEEDTVIRVAGGNNRQLIWIGFFKTTSTQEILGIKAFKATKTWRVFNIPPAPYELRLGIVLPKPGPRYPEPLPFSVSAATWR